jgi:hypothetical protein
MALMTEGVYSMLPNLIERFNFADGDGDGEVVHI